MRTTRLIATAAAAVAASATLALPAHAESQVRVDQRGDVTAGGLARAFDAEQSSDVVEVAAVHGDGRLKFTFTLAGLVVRPNELNGVAARFVTAGGRDWTASILRTTGEVKEVRLQQTSTGGLPPAPTTCDGLIGRTLPRQDKVVLIVPRDCVANPRSVRFGGSTFAFDADEGTGFRFFTDDARRNGTVDQNEIKLGTRAVANN